MHYGTQLVFSYGPLGFLWTTNLYVPFAALCAFAWAVLVGVAIFGILLRALRDLLPLPVAFLTAYVAGCSVRFVYGRPEVVLALAFAVAVWLITCRFDRYRWVELASLGLMLGASPLIKSSLGFGVLVLAIIAVVFLPSDRLRSAAVVVTVAVVTFAVGWFGTGNGVSNILPYVKTSISVVTGYSGAMVIGPIDVGWKPLLSLGVLVIVGGLTVLSCWHVHPRPAAGIALCVVGTLWLLAKESFVRLDGGHDVIFFAFIPIVVVAFCPRYPRLSVMGALAGSIVISYLVIGGVPALAYRPDLSVRHFGGQVLAFTTVSVRHQIESEGRSTMQSGYEVPTSMLAHMRGQTVDVDPWEQNVTWAYPGSKFDPLPVFQDYAAYTSSLDKIDATFLASRKAPSIILKEGPVAIDTRSPTFDPPLTQVDMECRYQQVTVSASWQLLKRSANRCGPVRRLSSVKTEGSGLVDVPVVRPGEEVLATFVLPSSLVGRLENLLARPPEVCMETKFAGGTSFPFRFIVGTATDLHVLRPATTLGYSPPFVPPSINALSFSHCGVTRAISGVRVTFYEMAIHP